ncbi:hypothetical protein ACFQV2_13435 [Actinokineospora soli]|uniref:Uncharacterized protein n=1 Tax=Actinokineospora soli TaxID=1048753 RepID=A0ABW2TN47_9PSEU
MPTWCSTSFCVARNTSCSGAARKPATVVERRMTMSDVHVVAT